MIANLSVNRTSRIKPREAGYLKRLNDSFPKSSTAALGRLHSMASGSFRDAKLERPVSGAELRRLLVASRPTAVLHGIPTATTGDRADRSVVATAHRQGSCRNCRHSALPP